MTDSFPALDLLAERFGIAREFWDWKGRHVAIPAKTIIAVLRSFDVDASSQEAAERELTRLEDERWLQVLPPCTVAEEGQGIHVLVHLPAGDPLRVHIELESGQTRPAWPSHNDTPDRWIAGRPYGEATYWLGEDLPTGYHWIVAETPAGISRGALIITPSFVGLPPAMRGQRSWGLSTQLYSVRSAGSWGIGDLSDLADLLSWSAAELSAGYVLINPLHAAQPVPPIEPSPYLPASRRFINPLYIRPEAIEEYADLDCATRRAIKELREEAREAGEDSVIDRNAVWPFKEKALRLIFEAHLRPSQHRNPPVTRVGFVVSKKVGNAVVRNRVKRRLRHIVAELNLPEGFDVVVRALPPAACSNLKPDLETALERALKRVPAC